MQREVYSGIIILVISAIVFFSLQQGIPLTGKATDNAAFDQDDIQEPLQYDETEAPAEEQSDKEQVTPPSEPANRDLRLQYADETPSVALFKPVNNERLANTRVSFTGYAASSVPLAGAMLYAIVDNREVPLLVNTDISGKFAKIEFTIPVQIPLGAYEWNIRACNRNGQCASAPQNFRMTVCGASC